MVQVDSRQWPVVYMKVDALPDVAAMNEYLAEMEQLLHRAEPFGIIYLSEMTDEDSKQKREKAAQKLSNDWLKANRERMGRYCLGIAMVTKATGIMKLYKPIARLTFKRTMGSPGDLFFTQTEAETWVKEQLSIVYKKEKVNVEKV